MRTAYCLRYAWNGDTFTTRAFKTLETAEAFVEHGQRVYPHSFEPMWLDERTFVQNHEGESVMVRFLIEEYSTETNDG